MYALKQQHLLSVIKRRKLAWYGHVTRHDSLSKTILQETVNGYCRRGGQIKTWIDNIKEWTRLNVSTLLRVAKKRDQWRTLCGDASALTTLSPTVYIKKKNNNKIHFRNRPERPTRYS
jgi:hypothetical protein